MAEFLENIRESIDFGKDVLESVEGLYGASKARYEDLTDAKIREFKNTYRPLELGIINGSNQTLRFDGQYFESGTWFVKPQPNEVPPGTACILFVANKTGKSHGVSGAAKYAICGTSDYLYIGFRNPEVGGYRTFIAVSNNRPAKWAFDNSVDDRTKTIFEENYQLSATLRKPRKCSYKFFEYCIAPN